MFKYRAIGFMLLIALLTGIFFGGAWGQWLFLAAAPLMTALAVYECARMLHKAAWPNFPRLAALFFYVVTLGSMLVLGGVCRCRPLFFVFWLMLIPFAGCFLLLTRCAETLSKVLHSIGILFLPGPGLFLLLTSFYCTAGNAPRGAWLFFLCLVTKATDTGGYITGTLTSKLPAGNHKIAPSISPNKSWEGLLGGMALSFLVSGGFFLLAPHASLWWYMLSALLLSLGSFFGDLAESAVKRLSGVKDSGNWVPGMGGAFDVLDSFLFNGILFFGLIPLLG